MSKVLILQLQFVAHAVNGLYGKLHIPSLEGGADTLYLGIHGALAAIVFKAPDCVQHFLPAEHFAGIGGQITEQLEVAGDEIQLLPVYIGGEGLRIQSQSAKLYEPSSVAFMPAAAEHGFYAHGHFPGGKGLGYIVICAHFQAQNAVKFISSAGKEDYGRKFTFYLCSR